jgi:hypothetical protein
MGYGPVVAMNLLALLTPALAALFAFLLISRLLGGQTWAALLGGYLFGFSPFIVGHQAPGHVVFFGAFLLPATIHLVFSRLHDEISGRAFLLALTAILVSQFLILMELFATMVFFGTIALGTAYFNWPSLRTRLRSMAWLSLIALAITAVLISPILYFALIGSGMGLQTPWSPLGGDLLELLIPKNALLLGEIPLFVNVSAHYQHWRHDAGAYVGLPMLLIVAMFFRSGRDREQSRFLAAMLAFVYVATLGTRLHFAGKSLFALPWWLFAKLPFLNSALPVRFSICLHLILAIIAATWMAQSKCTRAAKSVAAVMLVVFLLPNMHADYWAEQLETPEFFDSGQYRTYLQPGENVLVLPFTTGQASTWQALSGMYFAMPQGWIGPAPRSFLEWPIVYSFATKLAIPDEGDQLYAFLATHRVTAVIMDTRQTEAVTTGLALLGQRQVILREIGGVKLARPASALLEPYKNVTVEEMRCRMNTAQLDALIHAADQYLQRGYPIERLTPLAAQEEGLLPLNWVRVEDSSVLTGEGLYLGPSQGDRVEVGVLTSSQCANSLIDRYGARAREIYFPYPRLSPNRKVAQDANQVGKQGKLMLIFDHRSLDLVARTVNSRR